MIKDLLTKMSIHPVFWLVIAAGGLTGHLWETAIAFAVVLIHEFGHAAAAYRFGWTITKIELLPFGGVASIDTGSEHSFRQEFIVLISGPIQHLWIPLLSFLLLPFSFWGDAQHRILLAQNAALLLFNLLPVWPLDGGRLLHLFLERMYPYKSAYRKALQFSLLSLVSFCAVTLLFYPLSANLWIVIAFIALSIYRERRTISFYFLRFLLAMSRRKKPFRRFRRLTVEPDTPLSSVFSGFYKNSEHFIRIKGRKETEIDGCVLAAAFFRGDCAGKTVEACTMNLDEAKFGCMGDPDLR